MNRRQFLTRSAIAAAFSIESAAEKKRKASGPTLIDVSAARSLRDHAESHGLLVGCAVVPEHLDGESEYAATVASQSNILVPENAMKWQALRPAPDRYDFQAADEILLFAQNHHQRLRGHNLCWHESLPPWFESTVNRDNARQFLTEHIQTVAGHYAGKLHSWDVVNEAVDPNSGRADGLRKSPWLEFLGPGYIELAFQSARQADPNALLTYNDFGIETEEPDQVAKRAQVLMLVRRLVARKVPIDAVGVQSHLRAGDKPGAGLQSFVRELGHMGLQVFVTEMDVNEQKLEGSVADRDASIAACYKDYLSMMLAEPNVTAVLTWGITDRYTWLNGDTKHARPDGKPQRPLPFDSDYQPVPAFFAMRDALDTRVMARATRSPGASALVSPDASPQADPMRPLRRSRLLQRACSSKARRYTEKNRD